MRRNNLEEKLLVAFYCSTTESILAYSGCLAADREALQRVIKTAQRIIACLRLSLEGCSRTYSGGEENLPPRTVLV